MDESKGNLKKTRFSKKFFLAVFVLAALLGGAAYTLFLPPTPTGHLIGNSSLDFEENLLFTYEINRYSTHVEVSNASEKNVSIGFSLDPWNLNFGIVPSGGSESKRFITLDNVLEEESKIQLVSYGNISSMILFSDNNFLLVNGVPKPIEIMLKTGKETALGNYSGEIDIIIKRPKNSLARRLL